MVDDIVNVDQCTLPAAEPPEGEVSDFSDRGALVPAIIAVCSFMMATALVTTGGRLYVNRKQLAWSDCTFPQRNSFLHMMIRRLIRISDCCTAGLVFAVTETTLMFFRECPGIFSGLLAVNGARWPELHLARHQWDIPLCWLLGDTVKVGRFPG